ncbi:MAG: YHS domain-containing protein [Gemmatimonadaceae bacterium]
MAQTRDPVCGMPVETESAAYSNFMGTMYYFCTPECREVFKGNPTRYTARGKPADARADDPEPELEKHEPPFTKKGPIVAPKFGSAGSGGLEFEPGPERHGKEP